MAPPFTMPLALIPVVAFAVWRRVRRQFGPQPIQRKRMMARIAMFIVLGALIASLVMHSISLLVGLAGGLAAGVVLGLLGLRLSRFELDPVKGDCYVPHPYIGALVTALFLIRLLWRFSMLSPQLHDPAAAFPIQGPAMGQSPLTLALFGVFVGYYTCYFAGLLIHHQRLVRRQPDLRE